VGNHPLGLAARGAGDALVQGWAQRDPQAEAELVELGFILEHRLRGAHLEEDERSLPGGNSWEIQLSDGWVVHDRAWSGKAQVQRRRRSLHGGKDLFVGELLNVEVESAQATPELLQLLHRAILHFLCPRQDMQTDRYAVQIICFSHSKIARHAQQGTKGTGIAPSASSSGISKTATMHGGPMLICD
jgi:hypothetical protein